MNEPTNVPLQLDKKLLSSCSAYERSDVQKEPTLQVVMEKQKS